jgi:hypothetical protein
VEPDELTPDERAVLRANQAFYDAFERRSIDAMDDVWEHSDDAFCTHPGWQTLVGWPSVRRSWAALLDNSQHLQFVLTDESVSVRGETAYVRLSENLLAAGDLQGSVTSLNLFSRQTDGTWRMVAHHGSPVMRS